MGSVKDLEIRKKATENELGEGIFIFSDRYSIFDWGEMPDHIPYKGAALCIMAAWNFEKLEERGIKTHYLGVLDGFGKLCKTHELETPTRKMAIKLSRVIEPKFKNGKYDYSFFKQNKGKINNFVVPLENIYRRGAPKGSSLFKTIEKLEKEGRTEELKSLLSKYGLTKKPNPGDLFPKIGYDFATKFELSDRDLTDEEAYEISGLTEKYFEQLKNIRDVVVNFVGKRAAQVGLIDFDGKHEYVFLNDVLLADVVGTLDENRFMLNKEQVSKEFLRQYYKRHQKSWYDEIEEAKKKAKNLGLQDWKSLVKIFPQNSKPRVIKLVGEMYASASDRYTNLYLFKKFFKTRSLEKVIDDLKQYK